MVTDHGFTLDGTHRHFRQARRQTAKSWPEAGPRMKGPEQLERELESGC